ncbi:cardiolipin synthase [Alistipes sp.]|uniref:cardiolipin synthase n=1 Tax=Alistipes sp. TaxID=1872444 RepID=UPI003AF185C3
MARIVPGVRRMYILLVIHLLWTLCALVVVTRQQRAPAAAATWIALIFLVPVGGTLLYILAGYRRATPAAGTPGHCGGRLETLIASSCGTPPARHNEVTLLHNGNNAFSALIASLQRATHTIHMEYYIIRDDRIGRTIAEILIRKARAGLEVRVIYDAVGSWRLSRRMLRRMREAGVRTAAYEPIRFPWFRPAVTRRNHRKIVVTDGRVAYLGGINIAKYYLDGDYMGKWRDEHLRIEGDAVADLQRLFIADWARASAERLDASLYIAPHDIRRRLPIQLAWSEEGRCRAAIADAFAATIIRARRAVRICTPYFMPPGMLLDALRLAARSGVRVVVMIPTCSDSPFTDLVSDSYIGDLLDAGVELYRYENGFLHAKLLIVDDRVASVGTANLDYRSLRYNLEVTAFLYDRETVGELAATFDRDLTLCRRIPPGQWGQPLWRRTLGDVLRLVSPVM